MNNTTNYKERWEECLDAIEYTISRFADEDWLRAWVEGDEGAASVFQAWVKNGKPQ